VTVALNALDSNRIDAIWFNVAPPTAVAGSYAYFVSTSATLRVVNTVSYYDYTAYVGGVQTTLTSAAPLTFSAGAGLYGYGTDSNGNVTSLNQTGVTGYMTGNVSFVEAGSYIAYNDGANKSLAIDSATKFFKVTAAGVSEAPVTASVPYGSQTNIVYYRMNTAGTAAAEVYFTVS
jgi:hypothetical protein